MAASFMKMNMGLMASCIAMFCGVLILTMQLPSTLSMASSGQEQQHITEEAAGRGSQQHEQLAQWGASATKSKKKCKSHDVKVPHNITVYNYLSIQGPNSTTGYNTAQCGSPNKTQPNGFGRTFCFDMPLLLTQNLSSQLLGVVQGTYVFISLEPPGSTLFVSETFTLNTTVTAQGTFSASGLEQIGQVSSKPITGGTDAFAFVTGVATTTPLSNGVDSNGNLVSWFKYVFTFSPTSCS